MKALRSYYQKLIVEQAKCGINRRTDSGILVANCMVSNSQHFHQMIALALRDMGVNIANPKRKGLADFR
jgi:hypothetical protein